MVSKEDVSEEMAFNLRPEGDKRLGFGQTCGQARLRARVVQRPRGRQEPGVLEAQGGRRTEQRSVSNGVGGGLGAAH